MIMDSNPVFVPVEIQQCKFVNNKDMDDFLKLIPAWNDLLDDNIVNFLIQAGL